MTIDGSMTNQRVIQRHTRSRSALIRAAQDLLASGQPEFRLPDVAEKADVALQTLYNNFPNRDVLITAAIESALAEWDSEMLALTDGLEDPLEQLTANMRLFGRMPESHPRLAAILLNGGGQGLVGPRGYTPQALKHLRSIEAAGLIKPDNLDLALMTTVASTERLMTLRALDPSRSVEDVDKLALQNLQILGVSRTKALRLIKRELPAWPST